MKPANASKLDRTPGSVGVRGAVGGRDKAVRTWPLLSVLVAAILVAVTAGDMVVALLPLVAEDFHASDAQVGWVVTGYLLVLAVAIPLYGRISDFVNVRRVLALALGVFAAGSFICALSPHLAVLVMGRVVQGAGAAAIPVVSVVAATRALPPGKRGGGVGLLAASGGIGTAIGPIAGGAIGQLAGWSGLFWVAAAAALALVPGVLSVLREAARTLGTLGVHESGDRREVRFDLAGGAFLGLAVGLFLFGMTQAQEAGFASPATLGIVAGATLATALVVWRTATTAQPFVPPTLFRRRGYVAAMFVAFLSMLAYVAALVVTSLLVGATNGLSTRAAGLVLAPSGVAVALLSPAAGRLSDRVGAKALVLAGLAVMALSTLYLSTFAAGASPLLVSLGLMGVGSGFAFTNAPAKSAAVGVLPSDQLGVGYGIFEGAFFLGAGTGPAVIGTLLTARRAAGAAAINPLYALDAAPVSDAYLAMTAVTILGLLAALRLHAADTDRAPRPLSREAPHEPVGASHPDTHHRARGGMAGRPPHVHTQGARTPARTRR